MPGPGSIDEALAKATTFVRRVETLNSRYRSGEIHVRVPEALQDTQHPLEQILPTHLPYSHAALEAARNDLFCPVFPVAFDPAYSVGCFLATIDRDSEGEPYYFLDMGAQIATRAFGENDPGTVSAILEHLPYAVERYAHSDYQTAISLRMKAALDLVAPAGTPRHFIVNTGAESVENAIKATLLNRVITTGDARGGVLISFQGAFHGRTLGALAVTHRRRARMGFPTFDWPQAPFPADDPESPAQTLIREEKSLRYIWEIMLSGARRSRRPEAFRELLVRIDGFLSTPDGDIDAFVAQEQEELPREQLRKARRIAAVLVEPIQGEGGIRMATPRFFRRLRTLTLIFDVPLIFDEVQTGFGITGQLWAHELFDLPAPPDMVTWAKKAQNGILFASEELATFFQQEKKFNTTWEGDSAGMVRLLATLGRLDLDQVRRTGELARTGIEQLARDFPALIQNVRGSGVMLGFDVARADWRNILHERVLRSGLVLLPAGERTLRFYPRFDTEPYAIQEALEILRRCVSSILTDGSQPGPVSRIRYGTSLVPLSSLQVIDLDPESFQKVRHEIDEVEKQRYGIATQYPPDVPRVARRPLLQYPIEELETSVQNGRSAGIALRDSVTGRIVAYALGSALENYDEEGVREDPHFGEDNTFYLQAVASLPAASNFRALENYVLNLLWRRVSAMEYEYLSTLIEADLRSTGPEWLQAATELRVRDNYLGSGICFVYIQIALGTA